MKKLLLLAFAVACAVAANANVVVWNTGTIYGPGDGGTGFSDDPIAPGSTGYTATLYVFADAAMTQAIDLQSGYSSSTVTADSTIEGTTADVAALAEGTYYGYMTIIDPDGRELRSGGFSFETSDMLGEGNIYLGDGGNGITPTSGSLDDTYGAFSPTSAWSGGSGGGDVPEPTSGLLLVLGGAMLALRRRR